MVREVFCINFPKRVETSVKRVVERLGMNLWLTYRAFGWFNCSYPLKRIPYGQKTFSELIPTRKCGYETTDSLTELNKHENKILDKKLNSTSHD